MIEKLIEELIEALKANTEALKASSQPGPAPLPEVPASSVTTSQGSQIVTHDMTVITYGPAEQKAAQDVLATMAEAVEPPKRRGRPPKSIVPTIPKVTPEPTAEAAGATEVITEVVPEVIPEVIPPKPAITLEQVRGMGQKLLDLTGDPSAIRTYVNERGCKALRELKPEQWAEAYEWLSEKVKEIETP